MAEVKARLWGRLFRRGARPRARPEQGKVDQPAGRSLRLWDSEFALVKEGLSAEEVVSYVDELRRRCEALEKEKTPVTNPDVAAAQVLAEANRAAARIKAKALQEAEAEAARIVAEAHQNVQIPLNQAQKDAAARTEWATQNILAIAQRKAQIVENEARSQAQLHALKAREYIEGKLREEAKAAYDRLLASLQELRATTEKVEAEWTGKSAEMSEADMLGLMEGKRLSLSPPYTELAPSEEGELAPVAAEVTLAPELPAQMLPVEAATGATLAPQPTAEMPPVEAAQEATLPPEPSVEVQPGKAAPKAPAAPLKPAREFTQEERSAIYSGEVELVVAPPVNAAVIAQLYNKLLAKPEVKIIRAVGSWDKGTTITVLMERPLALINLLAEIPELKSGTPTSQGDLSLKMSFPKELGRILITTSGSGAAGS